MTTAGTVSPVPSANDVSLLLSQGRLAAADDPTLRATVRTALAVSNPSLQNVQSVDCVTCHTASRGVTLAAAARGVDAGFALLRVALPDLPAVAVPLAVERPGGRAEAGCILEAPLPVRASAWKPLGATAAPHVAP